MGFIPASSVHNQTHTKHQGTGPNTGDITGGSTKETTGGSSQSRSFRSGETDETAKGGGDRKEEVQEGDAETVRKGVAQQRSNIILYPGEHICGVCDKAIARVENVGKHYCWICWDKRTAEAGMPATGRSFIDAASGLTKVETLCRYCYKDKAECYVVATDKPICAVCWLKQGRPRTLRITPDNPNVRTGVRIS